MAKKLVEVECLECEAAYVVNFGEDDAYDVTFCACCGEPLAGSDSDDWNDDLDDVDFPSFGDEDE